MQIFMNWQAIQILQILPLWESKFMKPTAGYYLHFFVWCMVTCAASDVYVYLVKKDKRQMLTSERNGNKSSVQLTLNLFTITWITASVNKIHQKSFEPFEVLGKFSPVRFSWNERKNSEVTYILGGKSCLGWFIT